MNKITLSFDTCTPSPPQGYLIVWRVAGSSDSYTNAGNFFASPAVFYDTVNPFGTQYEGFIRSVSGDLDCDEIPWSTMESGSGGSSDNVIIINSAGGFQITSVMNIDGFVFEGPLHPGEQDTGTHTVNGSTGICVDVMFSGVTGAHLSLFINNVLIQCIPNINISGSNCFNGVSIIPTDEIRIELVVGASC